METQKCTRIIKVLFFQVCFICKCTGTHLPVVCWRTEMVLIEGGGEQSHNQGESSADIAWTGGSVSETLQD